MRNLSKLVSIKRTVSKLKRTHAGGTRPVHGGRLGSAHVARGGGPSGLGITEQGAVGRTQMRDVSARTSIVRAPYGMSHSCRNF